MPEKSHDQSMLDVWATGFGSGMARILEEVVGVSEMQAKAVAGRELNRLVRDPVATAQLLEVLQMVWDRPNDEHQDIAQIESFVLEGHGDPSL